MTLRQTLTSGSAALLVLLAALASTLELGLSAWTVGLACGTAVTLAVARGVLAFGSAALGPADLVTLTRVTLACGVAALVAEAVTGATSPGSFRLPVVALAATALVLDAVDGRVARRTGTSSAFGARFDGEADAFLIAVLSVFVASDVGSWVLGIGAARYLFGAAGSPLPWLRGQLPPRYWRKVVAAVQGIVLAAAAAAVASPAVTRAALLGALALLAESFGRDVWWLWRHRPSAA